MNRKQPDTKETNKEKGTESTIDQDQSEYRAEMGETVEEDEKKSTQLGQSNNPLYYGYIYILVLSIIPMSILGLLERTNYCFKLGQSSSPVFIFLDQYFVY